MAAGAFHGETQERAGRGLHAVGVVLNAKLLINTTAFVGLTMIPIKGRGGALFARGPGQQVAGDLPENEVIEVDVAVKGADDPIAPGPEMIETIGLVTISVRVTRHIQ